MTTTSTFAATRASRRSIMSWETPTAAAASRRPLESFAEFGYFVAFSISLIVIRPCRLPSLSTKGSFSMRCWRRMAFASAKDVPTGAVTRFSFVMISPMRRLMSSSKRMSRLVIMPTNLPSTVIGTPEILYLPINSLASASKLSGCRKMGSIIMPCSERFTLSTSRA